MSTWLVGVGLVILLVVKERLAWVPGWLSRLSVRFGPGHDLTVCGFEPHIRLCADSAEPASDSLSLPLFLPLSCLCILSFFLTERERETETETSLSLTNERTGC